MKWILTFLLLVFAVGFFIAIADKPSSSGSSGAPAADKASAKDQSRLERAVVGALSLRSSMRNPDSFRLHSVHITDAGAVCYQYRAQNGFGGMNVETSVLLPGAKALSQKTGDWNSNCAHKKNDDKTSEVNYALQRVPIE